MKIALIARERASGETALENISSDARTYGLALHADLSVSDFAGHAVALARERVADADLLVAVGGDGTLHEVVNGAMAGLSNGTPDQGPAIGLIAAGTANDFVRSIGGDGRAADLVSALAADSWCDIDIGRLSLMDPEGHQREVYFVNVADIGVGAEVVRRVAGGRRWLGATAIYLAAIIRVLARYRKRSVSIRSDEGLDYAGPLVAAAFGNGGSFGAGLRILPEASLNDGKIDSIVVGDVGLVDFLGKLHQLRAGSHIDHPEVYYHRCSAIEVNSDYPLGVEADGEFLGYLPATVQILPGAIRMPIPEPGAA